MSDEKIDLDEIETITRHWFGSDSHPVLALVRAVRVARAMFAVDTDDPVRGVAAMLALAAALAPFTDSAEVRSDGT